MTGCSKSGAPAPPVVPPSVETVNGSERLGWDQRAADRAELATIAYVVYIDGTRTPLTNATCATAASTAGFSCSAPLPAMAPGAHTLQLASFVTEGSVLESERSAALQLTVRAAVAARPGAAPSFTDAAVKTDHGLALRSELVTDAVEDPTDLAFVPDGRLLVAERGGRVRVIDTEGDGQLLPDPALSLADSVAESGLLALAVDADFERTHFVFAIYAAPSPAGALEFTLARFREASNTLADAVVLIDRIPASAAPAAALRFGADNKLYVAFDDGGDPRQMADASSLNGKTLRLNADGTTPADQPGMSPLYADGHRTPHGFEWDAKSRRPSSAIPESTAPYGGRMFPAFAGRVMMATREGRLVVRSADGRNETLGADRIGGVRSVAVSPDGAVYFATATAIGRLVPAGSGGP